VVAATLEGAVYGLAVEYRSTTGGAPDPLARAACHTALARQPGYLRRLALMADGWRRIVDLFFFTDPDAAIAALASDDWRALVAAHPACRNVSPALLVSECPFGGPVTLLRGRFGPTRGGQACWRDRLIATEPGAVLW
jgi:hypothetical protein